MSNELVLGAARAAVDAATAAAHADGTAISVVVVDHRGYDVLVQRGDGAPWFTAGVARAKAATAALMGAGSGDLAGLKAAHPELVDLIGIQAAQPLTTLPGGVPVRVGGVVLGAVGVSGADPAQDLAYAKAGVAALRAAGQPIA